MRDGILSMVVQWKHQNETPIKILINCNDITIVQGNVVLDVGTFAFLYWNIDLIFTLFSGCLYFTIELIHSFSITGWNTLTNRFWCFTLTVQCIVFISQVLIVPLDLLHQLHVLLGNTQIPHERWPAWTVRLATTVSWAPVTPSPVQKAIGAQCSLCQPIFILVRLEHSWILQEDRLLLIAWAVHQGIVNILFS